MQLSHLLGLMFKSPNTRDNFIVVSKQGWNYEKVCLTLLGTSKELKTPELSAMLGPVDVQTLGMVSGEGVHERVSSTLILKGAYQVAFIDFKVEYVTGFSATETDYFAFKVLNVKGDLPEDEEIGKLAKTAKLIKAQENARMATQRLKIAKDPKKFIGSILN